MIAYPIRFREHSLLALASGALFWPAQDTLCVADLHLGKALRPAIGGGAPLPPYEIRETLIRLESDLDMTGARKVIALGDSFDHQRTPERLSRDDTAHLARLLTRAEWHWIAGNHDPETRVAGAQPAVQEAHIDGIVLRHIAQPPPHPKAATNHNLGEISGHYHPKAQLPLTRGYRPAFLVDAQRIILPAYGAYTGGLRADAPVLRALMGPDARAILTDQARAGDPSQGRLLALPLSLPGRA